jgi:YggT family protein
VIGILIDTVNLLVWVLSVAIVIEAVLSWFIRDPRNPIMATLRPITEPILNPIRRFLPPLGGLDLSPLIALILLQVVRQIVVGILWTLQ